MGQDLALSPIPEHPSRLAGPDALRFQSSGAGLCQGITETLCRAEAFKKPDLLLTEPLSPHWLLLRALIHIVVCIQIRCPLRSSVSDGASTNAPSYITMYVSVRKIYAKVASSRDLCEMEPADPEA